MNLPLSGWNKRGVGAAGSAEGEGFTILSLVFSLFTQRSPAVKRAKTLCSKSRQHVSNNDYDPRSSGQGGSGKGHGASSFPHALPRAACLPACLRGCPPRATVKLEQIIGKKQGQDLLLVPGKSMRLLER